MQQSGTIVELRGHKIMTCAAMHPAVSKLESVSDRLRPMALETEHNPESHETHRSAALVFRGIWNCLIAVLCELISASSRRCGCSFSRQHHDLHAVHRLEKRRAQQYIPSFVNETGLEDMLCGDEVKEP